MFSEMIDIRYEARKYADLACNHFHWISETFVHFIEDQTEYMLELVNEHWVCECSTYKRWQMHPAYQHFCPHVVALELVAEEAIRI